MAQPPVSLSGNSTFTYPCGATYAGEFADGKLHGIGKLVWPDGVVYEGEFAGGLKHGRGVHTMADGAVYDGTFSKGLQDGKGCITYAADGSVMSYSWHAGDSYRGGWRGGKRHGACTYTFFNGETFECKWSEDYCLEFHHKQAQILSAPGMDTCEGRAAARAAANAKVARRFSPIPHFFSDLTRSLRRKLKRVRMRMTGRKEEWPRANVAQ
jgi:hypothetical protein